MKYVVQTRGKADPDIIDLPEVLPAGRWIAAGDKREIFWDRTTRTLVVRSPGSILARSFRLRQYKVEKSGDDPEKNVSAEFFFTNAGESAKPLQASVSLHLPGLISKDGATKAKKGLTVRSQINGKIIKVLVQAGQHVNKGDTLCMIEAMKMENRVFAAHAGTVESVRVKEGATIAAGEEILKLKND